MEAGYYRFPTIHDDTIVFVCEDDLWSVPASGGVARRLTSNPGQALMPALSPDGALLAFTGRDEGQNEIYLMPARGGPATRLTFLGANSLTLGWNDDGESILFAGNTAQPFPRSHELYTVSRAGGAISKLPTGPAMSASYGPHGGMVICRNTDDLARWKRYRGGRTGDIWLDPDGSGDWRRLLQLPGNLAHPLWLDERIFFVSDHEGIGNLYSCLPTGEDVRRHTHHADYYVRYPATDGRRIVYHAGADLYVYDPQHDQTQRIDVAFHSPRAQRKRKFVDAARYLQTAVLHPEGHSVAITARGKPFTMGNWEGPVIQHGDDRTPRYRLATWLHDGKRLAIISDATGEEALEVHQTDASAEPLRLNDLDIGRAFTIAASPKQPQIALANHRNELMLVDLDAGAARVLDRSRHSRINGIAWSPDGRWIAYGFSDTQRTSIIKLCRVESGETYPVTRPVLFDGAPAFDPEGKYLYFLSFRDFDPVYDNMHFDLGFPWGVRPFLITLQADLPSPFIPTPRPLDKQDSKSGNEQSRGENNVTAKGKDEKAEERPLQIDLDGIADRIVAFPVPAARYTQIRGIKGKALFSSVPLEGALNQQWFPENGSPAKGKLEAYSFEDQNRETLIDGIGSFELAQDNKTLIYRAGHRLRVLKAGEKPNSDHNAAPSRKSGWLNLGRVKISVEPLAEWKQMYREAWRLQRDQFWTEDMSGIDWQEVYTRYLPLLDRVATRAEFSDLLWEMQGELGTSHAYELGGDYRPEPRYHQGFLGADFAYDAETDSYRVERIVKGDAWDENAGSPLTRPGVNVKRGDRLIAVNGRKVSRETPPTELLVNQANSEALLTFAGADGQASRTCSIKTLRDETPARYREWVETNRRIIHDATDGRVGYVHVPDMGPRGFAEFHRGYLAEIGREGLIVDVRFNGGGHVSQLLLEKLARKRLGYDIQRWGEPSAYPADSVMGPMVALTNEHAGSDGDIFSHCFKLMQLGPLIGKRTWGGVIGIHPHDILADGGVTTQPEFSFWFSDVGWQVENYGTDPDIDVDIRPQDYASGQDPQLDRALVEIQRLLVEQPPTIPDFGPRPQLSLPTLPES